MENTIQVKPTLTNSACIHVSCSDEDLVLQEIMNGSVEREVYIGHDAQHMRGVLTLKYPIKNGVVRNWDEMEMVSPQGTPLCFHYVGVPDVLHVHLQ